MYNQPWTNGRLHMQISAFRILPSAFHIPKFRILPMTIYYHKLTISLYNYFWSVSGTSQISRKIKLHISYQDHIWDHISEKIKAYSVLGIIKRNFIYMDEDTFILLYKSMLCPHVEFANLVWCPYKVGDLQEIEKIQKRAIKLVIKLKNKSYID